MTTEPRPHTSLATTTAALRDPRAGRREWIGLAVLALAVPASTSWT